MGVWDTAKSFQVFMMGFLIGLTWEKDELGLCRSTDSPDVSVVNSDLLEEQGSVPPSGQGVCLHPVCSFSVTAPCLISSKVWKLPASMNSVELFYKSSMSSFFFIVTLRIKFVLQPALRASEEVKWLAQGHTDNGMEAGQDWNLSSWSVLILNHVPFWLCYTGSPVEWVLITCS